MNSRFLLLATLIFVFGACQTNPNEKNLKPDRLNWKSSNDKNKKGEELISYGGYPVYVKNLSIVNSVFDDYNMAKPGEGERSTFLFSSNRNSKGKDFDIVQYNALSFYYKYSNKRATVRLENDFCPMSNEIKKMLKKVNTSENEYGPYIFDLKDNFEFLFFYAQEVAGKLQLKMMANKLDSLKGSRCYLKEYGPFDIKLLNNKTYNVAYPSIQNSLLYYCSDKTGDFDISNIRSILRFIQEKHT